MTKLYIAGPMTGIPAFNIPAFDLLAGLLRQQGFEVVSPAELDDPKTRAAAMASPDGAPGTGSSNGETWGDFLARDVKLITDGGIECIVVLAGWERSRGARLETFVASALCGLPVVTANVYRDPPMVVLDTVPKIDLYRAWSDEPTLSVQSVYGSVVV